MFQVVREKLHILESLSGCESYQFQNISCFVTGSHPAKEQEVPVITPPALSAAPEKHKSTPTHSAIHDHILLVNGPSQHGIAPHHCYNHSLRAHQGQNKVYSMLLHNGQRE